MITAQAALDNLRNGNRRFVAGTSGRHDRAATGRRHDLVAGQQPHAVVLGCSDSRVPVEIIFDQGPGDLFVIRVAGNVAAPSQIGSVEFAVELLGTPLVVVLGHTGCGAVQATLEALARPDEPLSPHLRAIIDRIRPAVADLPAVDLARAVRANVLATVRQLVRGSAVIERRVRDGGLMVAGAEYSLETGIVEFVGEGIPT